MDSEVRRQAEETVKRCQEALTYFDEERKTLDAKLEEIKDEDRLIEERLIGIKKRKDVIKDAHKSRVTLENRLSMSPFSFLFFALHCVDGLLMHFCREVERSIDVVEESTE